jgi:hypothetical protein
MKDAKYLLKLAKRCSDLEKTAIEPEVIEQLKIWATELAEMAEDCKSRAIQPEMAEDPYLRLSKGHAFGARLSARNHW